MAIDTPNPYQPQAGGPLVTALRGINALQSDMQGNAIQGAQARYAPYQAYGNAFLTNQQAQWLPYQYQMQAASNPLLWMAAANNPKLQQQLSNIMSSPLPGNGSAPNIPMPGQSGNSLMSMLLSKLGNNQNSSSASSSSLPAQNNAMNIPMNNPMQNSNPSSSMAGEPPAGTPAHDAWVQGRPGTVVNPLVPSAAGGMAGAAGKMTAPYVESPFAGEALIPDPNNPGALISKAGSPIVTSAQQAIQGISNLKPILQDISKGAEKWLGSGMQGKLKAAQTINSIKQNFGDVGGIMGGLMKKTGLTTKDLSDYASWQADQQKAVETLMKARQWPQDAVALDKVSQIIQPIPGEGKEYGDRVTRELGQLETQLLPNYQKSLGSGFNLPANNAQTPQQEIKTPGGFDPIKMLDYKYKNANEFSSAFNTLNEKEQSKVIEEMKKRGWN